MGGVKRLFSNTIGFCAYIAVWRIALVLVVLIFGYGLRLLFLSDIMIDL